MINYLLPLVLASLTLYVVAKDAVYLYLMLRIDREFDMGHFLWSTRLVPPAVLAIYTLIKLL